MKRLFEKFKIIRTVLTPFLKSKIQIIAIILLLIGIFIAQNLVTKRQNPQKKASSCQTNSFVSYTDIDNNNTITEARSGDFIIAHLFLSGPLDAADIPVEYENTKLAIINPNQDIQKKNFTGVFHSTASGQLTTNGNINQILFILQREPDHDTAVNGEFAAITFKVITPATTTTKLDYGDKTLFAYLRQGGDKACTQTSSLSLIALFTSPTPTQTPTPTPASYSFELKPPSGQIQSLPGNRFRVELYTDSRGIAIKRLHALINFNKNIIKLINATPINNNFTYTNGSNLNNAYLIFETKPQISLNQPYRGKIGSAIFEFLGNNQRALITISRLDYPNGTFIIDTNNRFLSPLYIPDSYCYSLDGGCLR